MAESNGQDTQHEELKRLPSLVGILKSIARYSLQHPALMLTLAYVYVSAIGVAYTSALFSTFGINILDFAETTDFLLAALRQPVALVLSAVLAAVWVGYLLLVYAILGLPERAHAWVTRSVSTLPGRLPRFVIGFGHWRYTVGRFYPMFFALAVALALLAWCRGSLDSLSRLADREAGRITSGESALLVVELISSDAEDPSAIIEENVSLIGSSGSFAFFYDHNQQCIQIIPTANILRVYTVPPEPVATPTPTTEARDAVGGSSTAVAR